MSSATRRAVHNYLTSNGHLSVQAAARNLTRNFNRVVATAVQMEVPFPNTRSTRREVEELFLDFLEEAGFKRT